LVRRPLSEREKRSPGDVENAICRSQYRYGIDFNDQWRLRYRPPKRVRADVYQRLQLVAEAQRDAQIRKLKHEGGIPEALVGCSSPAVVAPGGLGCAYKDALATAPGAQDADTGAGATEIGRQTGAGMVTAAVAKTTRIWMRNNFDGCVKQVRAMEQPRMFEKFDSAI